MKNRRAFNSIRAESLSDRIVAQVLEALFAGEFQAGEFFGSEGQLAETFQTSRVPIRAALSRLAALGVVKVRPGAGGGATIGSGDPSQFAIALAVQFVLIKATTKEIFDARIAIESMAAELAAARSSPEMVARLRRLVDEVRGSERNRPEALSAAVMAFHTGLVEASGNRTLIALMTALAHVLQNTYLRAGHTQRGGVISRSLGSIVDCVEQSDAGEAETRIRAMLIRARTALLARLDAEQTAASGGRGAATDPPPPRDPVKERGSPKAESASDLVVAQVLEALFAGDYQAGQFFGSEAQLAETFQTSRVAIRGALSRLAALGVVRVRPGAGGGATIGSGDPSQFATALAVQFVLVKVTTKEIFDARIAIESMAAELAAARSSPEMVARLRQLLDQVQKSERKKGGELSRAIMAFHTGVVEASGNRTLAALMAALVHVLQNTYLRMGRSRKQEFIIQSLAPIIDAIEKRDPAAADFQMRSMLTEVRDALLARIEGEEARPSAASA